MATREPMLVEFGTYKENTKITLTSDAIPNDFYCFNDPLPLVLPTHCPLALIL